jgi:hypothetical protein
VTDRCENPFAVARSANRSAARGAESSFPSRCFVATSHALAGLTSTSLVSSPMMLRT